MGRKWLRQGQNTLIFLISNRCSCTHGNLWHICKKDDKSGARFNRLTWQSRSEAEGRKDTNGWGAVRLLNPANRTRDDGCALPASWGKTEPRVPFLLDQYHFAWAHTEHSATPHSTVWTLLRSPLSKDAEGEGFIHSAVAPAAFRALQRHRDTDTEQLLGYKIQGFYSKCKKFGDTL